MDLSDDERAMLRQAIERAGKLLAELIAQQDELERHPPKIAAADLVAGRTAMRKAIAAARRTVKALHDAQDAGADEDQERSGG